MIKLLLSAYIIIFLPWYTTGLTMEFLINNKFLAGSSGMASGDVAVIAGLVVFIVEQLAATAIVKRLLWRR
jgi:hypothetical protein